jgi:hypothetical protein
LIVSISTLDGGSVKVNGGIEKLSAANGTASQNLQNIEQSNFRVVNLQSPLEAGSALIQSKSEFLLAPFDFESDDLEKTQKSTKKLTYTLVDSKFLSFIKGAASVNDLVCFKFLG